MSNELRSEETISRRHNIGQETFYVELHRRATLSEDLSEIIARRVDCIAIYLGDGTATARRDEGHNNRVGITVEMAEWLHGALGEAIAAAYDTAAGEPFREPKPYDCSVVPAFAPAPDGQFYLGDKVRVVLEGVLESYDADLGHYTIRGNTRGAQHVEWIHNLHWGTEFKVIEPGPRASVTAHTCDVDCDKCNKENP